MRALRTILIVIFSLLLTACSNRLKEIELTSVDLLSVSPKGLSGISAQLELGIHNPAMAFEISDLGAILRFKSEPALLISAEPLVVEGRCDKLYIVPLDGRLAEGFNPFKLLQLLGGEVDMSDLSLDVKAKVALRNGLGKDIEYKDIALDTLLEKL